MEKWYNESVDMNMGMNMCHEMAAVIVILGWL